MRINSIICIACGLLIALNTLASDKDELTDSLLELTTTPISGDDSLNPHELAVWGIHLGMPQIKVKKMLAPKAGVYLRQDKFHNSRMYLYQYNTVDGQQKPLAYFKWSSEGKALEEIIIYPGFAQYMPSPNDYLVTAKVLLGEKNAKPLFPGEVKEKEAILEVPNQGIYHQAFYFLKPGFRVIKQVKGDEIKYTFSWFKAQVDGRPPEP